MSRLSSEAREHTALAEIHKWTSLSSSGDTIDPYYFARVANITRRAFDTHIRSSADLISSLRNAGVVVTKRKWRKI